MAVAVDCADMRKCGKSVWHIVAAADKTVVKYLDSVLPSVVIKFQLYFLKLSAF